MRFDDSNRVRGGAEYVVNLTAGATPRTLAIRGGFSSDPQHQFYYQPDDPATGMPDPRASLYFPKGKDAVHVSSGVGLVLGRLQVDAAFDVANIGHTFALSTVLGFSR